MTTYSVWAKLKLRPEFDYLSFVWTFVCEVNVWHLWKHVQFSVTYQHMRHIRRIQVIAEKQSLHTPPSLLCMCCVVTALRWGLSCADLCGCSQSLLTTAGPERWLKTTYTCFWISRTVERLPVWCFCVWCNVRYVTFSAGKSVALTRMLVVTYIIINITQFKAVCQGLVKWCA